MLLVADATNYATAEVGGGIAFSARYHSNGSYAQMGNIQGIKETTGNGNYAGALTFRTRTHGANNDERLRISSVGALGIGGANYGTSGQVLTSQGASSAPQWADASSGALGYDMWCVDAQFPAANGWYREWDYTEALSLIHI